MAKPIKIYTIKITEYDRQGNQVFAYIHETCYRKKEQAHKELLEVAKTYCYENSKIVVRTEGWVGVWQEDYEPYSLMVLEHTLK